MFFMQGKLLISIFIVDENSCITLDLAKMLCVVSSIQEGLWSLLYFIPIKVHVTWAPYLLPGTRWVA